MVGILKSVGMFFLLFFIVMIASATNTFAAAVITTALAAISLFALFKPFDRFRFGSRIYSGVVLIFMGILALGAWSSESRQFPSTASEVTSVPASTPYSEQEDVGDIESYPSENDLAANIVATPPSRPESVSNRPPTPGEIYMAEIAIQRGVLATMGNISSDETLETVSFKLAYMVNFSEVYKRGLDMELTPEQIADREQFGDELSRFQRQYFPRLRDSFGPALRREVWIDNGSARTRGEGYRTLDLYSPAFFSNRNIQDVMDEISQVLRAFRFNRVEFRAYEGQREYTWYEVRSLNDGDLSEVLRGEHVKIERP